MPRVLKAVFFLVFLLSTSGCNLSLLELPFSLPGAPASPITPSNPTATPYPRAKVTFQVTLPAPLPPGEMLLLSLQDEVTHPALSVSNYPMQAIGAQTYQATLPLTDGSLIAYRYLRGSGAQVFPELNAENAVVQARRLYVNGEMLVKDMVAAWPDVPFQGATGIVQGELRDAQSQQPLADILVSVAGYQVLSDALGRFFLPHVPVGTHNLLLTSLDGVYSPFQQGAVVEQGMVTPVEVSLSRRPLVTVTFVVSVPANTQAGAPLRIAGNLLPFGNLFAEGQGGERLRVARMPQMRPLPDGRYALAIQLPAGAYLQYKYTLGDGFWNAEQDPNQSQFPLRERFIPAEGGTFEDQVLSWQKGNAGPILFEVTVPPNTPLEDTVYIQFNAAGWSEPLPMWRLNERRWIYRLYGPLHLVRQFRYRYCRNAQCGIADEATTNAAAGHLATVSLAPQDLQDTVQRWRWLSDLQSTVIAREVQPHGASFMAGVEFLPQIDPAWLSYTALALRNLQAIQANWVIYTPGWEADASQPFLYYRPGRTPLNAEMSALVRQAQAAGLQAAIFPVPRLDRFQHDYWAAAPRTPEWWQAWFESYRRFALHYAEVAQQSAADALILGGEWTAPAISNGVLPDGSPSGAPANADDLWRLLLRDVRARYSGRLLWAMPASPALMSPAFLDQVDGIYLLVSIPLSEEEAPSKETLSQAAERWMVESLTPFQQQVGKPLILALAYPSVRGAARACLGESGRCLPWEAFNPPQLHPAFPIDLSLQADIYEAFLNALNSRAWIGGLVSRGYYPPAILQDPSASIHGKPTSDLLWYWFPRLRR